MADTPSDLETYRAFAIRLADAARKVTLPHFRNNATVFNKAGALYDPVTDADRDAERVQREMIEAVFPDHSILGEEFGEVQKDSPWRWVLDPVDGTRAFVCGIASWMTLIALEYEGAPVVSVLDQPFLDERWIGVAGASTYERGEQRQACKTSGLKDLSAARISTSDPRASEYFSNEEAARFEAVASATRLARFSLDAYGYALVASGELDLVIEAGLQRHDWAALKPVVEGAGGVFTNWRGDVAGSDDRGEIVAAATPELHEAALKFLAA